MIEATEEDEFYESEGEYEDYDDGDDCQYQEDINIFELVEDLIYQAQQQRELIKKQRGVIYELAKRIERNN